LDTVCQGRRIFFYFFSFSYFLLIVSLSFLHKKGPFKKALYLYITILKAKYFTFLHLFTNHLHLNSKKSGFQLFGQNKKQDPLFRGPCGFIGF